MKKPSQRSAAEPTGVDAKSKRHGAGQPLPHQINVADAKAHLSRLVDAASRGETFIIAKAGRPVAKIGPPPNPYRIGWGAGILTNDQVEALLAAVERPMTEQELAAWYDAEKFK